LCVIYEKDTDTLQMSQLLKKKTHKKTDMPAYKLNVQDTDQQDSKCFTKCTKKEFAR